MTRLQLRRPREARSRRASAPRAAALAQDVHGSDASPRCESGRHGHWHPQGRQAKATPLFFQIFFALYFSASTSCCLFLHNPPPPLSKRNSTPLLLRCTFGQSIRLLQSLSRLCFTGTTIQQPVSAEVLFRLWVPETYRKCKSVVQIQKMICRFTPEKK